MRAPAAIAIAAVVSLLAACAAGPDYARPAPDPHAGYGPIPGGCGGSGSPMPGVVAGGDVAGDWWTLFRSRALDALIAQALARNPDLAAAEDGLLAAREAARASRGTLWPSVSAGFAAARQRTSAQLSPTPGSGALVFDLYTPLLSVSYVPDVFGGNRRAVEAMEAQADQARYALAAAHVALCANVASAAIQEASLRAQLDAMRMAEAADQEAVDLLRRQMAAGYASRLDLAAAEAQLAQARAALPPLLLAAAQLRDLLASLAGSYPDGGPPSLTLDALAMPAMLPVSLPSRLIDQRPDVRQAEANLHAACARVGVAVADRLPVLSLSGDLGSMALALGRLLTRDDAVWLLGASVTEPVFAGGALRHQERAARAAWAQAREQYRSTVLAAFANVADALHALDEDSRAWADAQAVLDAAHEAGLATARQEAAGYGGRLATLAARAAEAQAEAACAQARAARLVDAVGLLTALGGGWWNREEPRGH